MARVRRPTRDRALLRPFRLERRWSPDPGRAVARCRQAGVCRAHVVGAFKHTMITREVRHDEGKIMRERLLARLAILSLLGLASLSAARCGRVEQLSAEPLPPVASRTVPPELEARRRLTPSVSTAPSSSAPSPSPSHADATPSTSVAEAAASTLLPERTLAAESGRLRVTLLYDDRAADHRLETSWGFSCLVEGLEKSILFDTGGDSGVLLRNMSKLGIDPQDVDVVMISHAHGDHLGGLAGFLGENSAVSVHLPQSFPERVKDDVKRSGAELVEVGGWTEICARAYSTGELGTRIKEQSLVIDTDNGLLLITGCAHSGIVRMVEIAKELTGREVYLVMGGFHLSGTSGGAIQEIVDRLRELGVAAVAPCHCTGTRAMEMLAAAYRERYLEVLVGTVLTLRL